MSVSLCPFPVTSLPVTHLSVAAVIGLYVGLLGSVNWFARSRDRFGKLLFVHRDANSA